MKKTIEILSVIIILLFVVSSVSANTFFTENEDKILENRNKDKAVEASGEPEGYSEPESAKNSEYNVNNTLFNKDEWNMLENWNKDKSDKKIGEPEGYSEPESENEQGVKLSNTLFTEGEM